MLQQDSRGAVGGDHIAKDEDLTEMRGRGGPIRFAVHHCYVCERMTMCYSSNI